MKNTIPFLKKGESIIAVVEEVISSGEVICSFRGDLLRVRNSSKYVLKKNDAVILKVESVLPLKFAVNSSNSRDRYSRSA